MFRYFAPMALCIAGPVSAQSDTSAASLSPLALREPPPLTTTRYDERYEQLANPEARTGRWTEPFKYIPIGDSDAYLTTGIELRARTEVVRNASWDDRPDADDGYLWLRALPYADLRVGRIRGFVQPIAAYSVGVSGGPGPIDETRTDILQGFVDLELGSAQSGQADDLNLTLRAGRQMLSLGSERLVGTRYGPNVPLAFDGFRGLVSADGAVLSFIAVRPVESGPSDLDDRRSRARSLYGAYLTLPTPALTSSLDLYWLGYENNAARFSEVVGPEERHSLGVRLFGQSTGWRWNVESVYQFGRFSDDTISAWTLASEVGHDFAEAPLKPNVTLRANVVSGDRRAGDGRIGTFNALFPKGQYFGELSPVGPANIINVSPQVSFAMTDSLSASVAVMAYWRFSTGDGIYDVPGNRIRAPGSSKARSIGRQIEASLAWQATPEFEVSTSLSAFEAGAFIRQTGKAETISMLAVETNFRF